MITNQNKNINDVVKVFLNIKKFARDEVIAQRIKVKLYQQKHIRDLSKVRCRG